MKTLKFLIWILLIAYIVYLYQNSAIIVKPEFIWLNIVIHILIVLFSVFIIFTALKTIKMRRLKWFQLFLWLILISISYFLLQDNPSKNIFIRDIIIVLGVAITIAAPTWFLISKKVEKKLEEDVTEIIEV